MNADPTPPTPEELGAEKTISQMLGEVTWLLTQSPIHKQLFVGDLEWFCMPPIIHRTFRMFYGPDTPAAVVFYANVSEETNARLMAGAHKLRAEEWVGGDIAWLIELVAPFGAHEEIMADFALNIFPDKAFKYHRITPSGEREVATWEPLLVAGHA